MVAASPVLAPVRIEHRRLAYWMEKVLEELENVRQSPDPDAVHDLRVVLRRCRSLAAVLQEVDSHPAWRRMRKAGRKLFRGLGNLRDVQVQTSWVKKLSEEGDPLRAELLSRLDASEKALRVEALRLADGFDAKNWKRLEKLLLPRADVVPPNSLAAECLALERWEEARDRHTQALRTPRAKTWHALRIGVKRYRYTVEGLLPELHAGWSEGLKRLQDILGEIHDLDVLSGLVRETAPSRRNGGAARWQQAIAQQRQARVDVYRQLTLGTTSLWNKWRLRLPDNSGLEAAAQARIEATAHANDPHPRKSERIARLAAAIFHAFAPNALPPFDQPRLPSLFAAAVRLHGIRPVASRKPAHKAASKFLGKLPPPPGWTESEWKIVALAIRLHRGKALGADQRPLAKRTEAERKQVNALAGILGLARLLRRTRLRSVRRIRAELRGPAVILFVPGWSAEWESAARFARARRLLEQALGRELACQASEPGAASAPQPETPLAPAPRAEEEEIQPLQHTLLAN
jgi:CHAD domain-containing protein